MSYGSRRHIIHIDIYGVVNRLEFHQRNYTGASEGMLADAGQRVAVFDQKRIDTRSESGPRMLDASLDVHQILENVTDEQLLEDIFAADEDEFLLVWKKNGVIHWTGSVMNDLFEGMESSYPWTGVATAKDFSLLSGVDYQFTDDRKTIIEVIADLLGGLPFSLDIETSTSWQHGSSAGNEDFLQRTFMDTVGLREYARTGDEQDETITHYKALEWICDNYQLFIKQEYGQWRIFQKSAFEDPQNVWTTVYNPDGTQKTAGALVDRLHTYDVNDGFIIKTEGTNTRGVSAVRRARVKYDHRTGIAAVTPPESVELTGSQEQTVFEQFILSEGNQTFSFSADVIADIAEGNSDPLSRVRIRAGQYYLQDDLSWTTSINNFLEFPMTLRKPNVGGGASFTGSISIITDKIPSDADGTLSAVVANPAGSTDFAIDSEYYSINTRINNPIAVENSTSIDYQITQSQTKGLSTNVDLRDVKYGEGPVRYSTAALRFSVNDNDLIGSSWGRRGQTLDQSFFELYLRSFIDARRNHTKAIAASTYGLTDSRRVELYNGRFFIYGGGIFDIGSGDWTTAELVEVRVQTSTDDAFSILENFDETGVSANRTGVSIVQDIDNLQKFSNQQKITKITQSLSGTVTQIPIDPVDKNFISVGEPLYLFNLFGASLTEFFLAEPQLPNATTLTVDPVTLNETIAEGSWVVFTGERVANFITRSDDGIRLGVRSYSQAVTADGESYVDEEGNGYVFVDEGDQTAINQGTTSEIAILKGEIVVKTTAGGQLALVRLDAKPESGSLVEIQADNINLQGLVTAINSGGSETQIDGGKIKADTSVVVGTGNNIAALTGNHPTVRMYAGNADPAAAPFRVLQDGSVIGTKFVQLSGEEVDGVIEQFSIRDLLVTGALTIGPSGMLRTSDDETIFGEDGIQFSTPENFTPKNSLVWVSDVHEDAHITAFASGNIPRLEYKSRQHRFRDDENNTFMIMNRFDSSLSDLGKNMQLVPDTISIDATKLPNSRSAAGAPGGVYAVQGSDQLGDYWTLRIRRTD